MIRKFSPFLPLVITATILSGCSKDDDDNLENPTASSMLNELTAATDLEEGSAEYTGRGDEEFSYTNATASWIEDGAFTTNGRTYAQTAVHIVNAEEDVRLTITFSVHDSTAGSFGGKFPEQGTYNIGLTMDEQSSEETEHFASIYIYGDDWAESYSDITDAVGTVTLTSTDDNVLTGHLEAEGLGDAFSEDATLDLAASFKAPHE